MIAWGRVRCRGGIKSPHIRRIRGLFAIFNCRYMVGPPLGERLKLINAKKVRGVYHGGKGMSSGRLVDRKKNCHNIGEKLKKACI